jgi:SET domain-containing protein
MQVAYEVKNAAFGKGLFATKDIARGTLIWQHGKANLHLLEGEAAAQEYLSALTAEEMVQFLHAAYWSGSTLVDLRLDDGQFFNHNAKPNVALGEAIKGPDGVLEAKSTYALRDIVSGEELVDDYKTYGWSCLLYTL